MSLQGPAIEFNRVSSAEQLEGNSLEAQQNGNQEYARKHKLKIVRSWSVDESASKELDRKQFDEAVQFVRSEGIKHIIFHKVDRAVRGFRGALLGIEPNNHVKVTGDQVNFTGLRPSRQQASQKVPALRQLHRSQSR